MGRRALLLALVAAAPVADAAGAHGLAFWLLVGAVPTAAACGLTSYGAFLERRDDVVVSLQALLWIPTLGLLLAAAAARGPAIASSGVPRLGVTALIGCVALLALKAAVFACVELYRGSSSASSVSMTPARSSFRAPVAAKPARS